MYRRNTVTTRRFVAARRLFAPAGGGADRSFHASRYTTLLARPASAAVYRRKDDRRGPPGSGRRQLRSTPDGVAPSSLQHSAKAPKGGLLRNDCVGAAAKQGVSLTPPCSSGVDLWRREGGFSSALDAAPPRASKRAALVRVADSALYSVACARDGKGKTRRNTKTLAYGAPPHGGRTWCNRGFA
ncbi:hypothetical protein MTO96_013480 [Rhipicephalus appendiculatus]